MMELRAEKKPPTPKFFVIVSEDKTIIHLNEIGEN